MISFKLKRKMSGRKIRKNIRENELRPMITATRVNYDTREIEEYQYRYVHRPDLRYKENKPIKRLRDNPTLYEGEEFSGYGTLRQPRKCRKTAWKRHNKIVESIKKRQNGGV